MKKSTQVLMLTAGGIILAFIVMGLTVDMKRFTADLMPWISLMFGAAFLCVTLAYGDIKSERTPRQKKAVRLFLLLATLICFAVATTSFIQRY
jgi:predicted MFS family arabinose efflux permease